MTPVPTLTPSGKRLTIQLWPTRAIRVFKTWRDSVGFTPPVHNTCLPDLPPEVVAAKRERPKSWLPCEFLTSSCVRKLYNKLSLLLITCSKRFGPFRPLSESYRENGILDALRFGYGLGRGPQAFFYVPIHTHSTDVNDVILNYGCKVTNNIWNNNK